MDPVPEAVVVVGVDVPAVNRREAVAVGDQHFDRPPRRRSGAREPFCADLAPALFPRLHARDRLRDERVVADRVVALEVQPEEHRDGIRALVGDVEQDGHEMLVALREIDGDLLARGHVAQRVAVFAQDLEMQAFGASGSFPVDLGLEQRQQLGGGVPRSMSRRRSPFCPRWSSAGPGARRPGPAIRRSLSQAPAPGRRTGPDRRAAASRIFSRRS